MSMKQLLTEVSTAQTKSNAVPVLGTSLKLYRGTSADTKIKMLCGSGTVPLYLGRCFKALVILSNFLILTTGSK